MNKIEKLSKEYAEYMCPVDDYCGGVYDEQRNSDLPIYTDDARSVLKWLFSKPLTDRLTEDEKAAIRNEYARTYPHDIDRGVDSIMVSSVMERIFGKEIFKDV